MNISVEELFGMTFVVALIDVGRRQLPAIWKILLFFFLHRQPFAPRSPHPHELCAESSSSNENVPGNELYVRNLYAAKYFIVPRSDLFDFEVSET